MPAAKPYYTSNDLIEAVKRKIAMPISQNTFTETDILKFANEEMFIAQVPSILEYHEEYFVYKISTPLVVNKSRYPIPDRAIGMRLRNIFWADQSGNLTELTRIDQDDAAYFQHNLGANESIHKFYLEGNDVVLTPTIQSAVTGSLVFYIYLRPNQLVKDGRAAIVNYFTKNIAINVANMVAGNTLTVNGTVFTAVSGAPATNQFQIVLGNSIATATNLVSSLNLSGVTIATNGTPSTSTVTVKFYDQNYTITTNNPNAFIIATQKGVEFENLPSTYLDLDTRKTEDLFKNGVLIDFLQTKPGHRTRKYDIRIPNNGIQGNIINFSADDVPEDLIIGDYICLANESIIPQIPPDLHNLLAERTCARILAAQGDQAGLSATNQKIAEMELRQGNLIDNRVDGAYKKINGRHSILRFQGINSRRRF